VTTSTTTQAALARLDELTRRLRRECPWDRAQDERSIVGHTVEEAYELADAAWRGDDAKLLDELGDVLFQVCFLALLLEERGAGDLAQVADGVRAKLIRRHPHVFGDVEVSGAGQVLRNWDRIKQGEAGREQGVFGELPESLPATLYARKVRRRASAAGHGRPALAGAVEAVEEALAGTGEPAARERRFEQVGDLLLAAVDVAGASEVDPELALRAAADRVRRAVESVVARSGGAPLASDGR